MAGKVLITVDDVAKDIISENPEHFSSMNLLELLHGNVRYNLLTDGLKVTIMHIVASRAFLEGNVAGLTSRQRTYFMNGDKYRQLYALIANARQNPPETFRQIFQEIYFLEKLEDRLRNYL